MDQNQGFRGQVARLGLAALFAGQLMMGCDDSDSSDSSQSSQSTQTQAEQAPVPTFKIVGDSSQGAGCLLSNQNKNSTAIITNSMPDGPKDYAQWTFDSLTAGGGNDAVARDCELTLQLEWTPGYRLVLKSAEIDVFITGDEPDEEGRQGEEPSAVEAKVLSTIQFSRRRPQVERTMVTRMAGDLSAKLVRGEGMSSDCSGKGQWSAKLSVEVAKEQAALLQLGIDQASVLFELPKGAALEKCL